MSSFFRSPIVRGLLVLILGALCLFSYARWIEPSSLRIESISIASSHVPNSADSICIAVIADTHFGEYYTLSDFDKTIDAVTAANPDLIVFLGDLIDNYAEYTTTEDPSKISALLATLEAPLGKYAVFGNHDYGGGAEEDYRGMMEDGGFTVLINEAVTLASADIRLIGIDDMLIGYGDPSIAKEADPSLFNVVLVHEPDAADLILEEPFDLMLAGHTHGRQVNLSLFDDLILPPGGRHYIQGLYELPTKRNAKLYVNAGIGTTKLPFRFRSAPELTLLTLSSQSSE